MEDDMAKGQLRSNREKKKPKADKNKTKASIPASPWAPTQFLPTSTRAVPWQEDLMRAEPDDARNLAASVWSATDHA